MRRSQSQIPCSVPVAAQDLQIAAAIAWTWLALGSVSLLCFPALWGSSVCFGWLPFWLLVAPLADLLILRWRPLLSWSHATFANLRRRRRSSRRAVAPGAKKHIVRRPRRQGRIGSALTALITDY
ncbi:MAG: hypothetical protein ACREPT_13545 [Rudaea sp.]